MTLEDLLKKDSKLAQFRDSFIFRKEYFSKRKKKLLSNSKNLKGFALGHLFFGVHLEYDCWVFREWAPEAKKIYLLCKKNAWQKCEAFKFTNYNSYWELKVNRDVMKHGSLYSLYVEGEKNGERIPAWSQRVIQDQLTHNFKAQIWNPTDQYQFKYAKIPIKNPLIYEVHIGMSSSQEKVSTFQEFTQKILDKIIKKGYNTIQLMAIMEHSLYGSFGYQVSSFFAVSSRFGTPEDLKKIIDICHQNGISVIMDIIHSHAIKNEVEGLSCYDGSCHQFFYKNEQGYHSLWDSRCFDYGKDEVVHFLLSNCRYWIEEFNFDGFRWDGVTSMLYHNHGVNYQFSDYKCYFDENFAKDAAFYLSVATQLTKEIDPCFINIAEDVSGLPALCLPPMEGGVGFDIRMHMGIADYWVKMIKEVRDESWHVGEIFYQLRNQRQEERTINYVESHDQALVGDKTLIFRILGTKMYDSMHQPLQDKSVRRGINIIKIIKLITILLADYGYLNFMGNEFGHPEWIDFPREGNGWSYKYARRLWDLENNCQLLYPLLSLYDKSLISFIKNKKILSLRIITKIYENIKDQILIFKRGKFIAFFNFGSREFNYRFEKHTKKTNYQLVFDTDDRNYGGENETFIGNMSQFLFSTLDIHLPAKTAFVIEEFIA